MHYIALSDLFVMQSLSTQDQRMLSCDYRWSQFKSGASRRNISVDIDKRQYTQLICSPCHYCARAPAAAFRIGIDRERGVVEQGPGDCDVPRGDRRADVVAVNE